MATKYPPNLSLEEAIRVIKEIHAQHRGREVSIDLMPEILRTKQSSSFFPAKIAALQRFGLVEKRPNDLLELTDLAMQIVNPIGDEDAEAKLQAFRKIDVLAELLQKYPNLKLPSADQLKHILLRTFHIPRERAKNWYDFVVESFRVLGQGKERLERALPVTVVKSDIGRMPSNYALDKITLPSNKKFEYALEEGYTTEDLDFVIRFFELKKEVTK